MLSRLVNPERHAAYQRESKAHAFLTREGGALAGAVQRVSATLPTTSTLYSSEMYPEQDEKRLKRMRKRDGYNPFRDDSQLGFVSSGKFKTAFALDKFQELLGFSVKGINAVDQNFLRDMICEWEASIMIYTVKHFPESVEKGTHTTRVVYQQDIDGRQHHEDRQVTLKELVSNRLGARFKPCGIPGPKVMSISAIIHSYGTPEMKAKICEWKKKRDELLGNDVLIPPTPKAPRDSAEQPCIAIGKRIHEPYESVASSSASSSSSSAVHVSVTLPAQTPSPASVHVSVTLPQQAPAPAPAPPPPPPPPPARQSAMLEDDENECNEEAPEPMQVSAASSSKKRVIDPSQGTASGTAPESRPKRKRMKPARLALEAFIVTDGSGTRIEFEEIASKYEEYRAIKTQPSVGNDDIVHELDNVLGLRYYTTFRKAGVSAFSSDAYIEIVKNGVMHEALKKKGGRVPAKLRSVPDVKRMHDLLFA